MKFVCDQCHTKYAIDDGRVRGKVLKIRCKACHSLITVRDPAFGEPQRRRVEGGDRAPAPGAAVSPSAVRPPAAPAEWYVSFDGEQEGPFDVERARGRVLAELATGKEAFAWRDGFSVWLPVAEVPEVAPPAGKGSPAPGALPAERPAQLRSIPPEPVAAGPAGPPAIPTPPGEVAPAQAVDDSQLEQETEHPARRAAELARTSPARPSATVPVPGVRATPPVSTAPAPAAVTAPAAPSAPAASSTPAISSTPPAPSAPAVSSTPTAPSAPATSSMPAVPSAPVVSSASARRGRRAKGKGAVGMTTAPSTGTSADDGGGDGGGLAPSQVPLSLAPAARVTASDALDVDEDAAMPPAPAPTNGDAPVVMRSVPGSRTPAQVPAVSVERAPLVAVDRPVAPSVAQVHAAAPAPEPRGAVAAAVVGEAGLTAASPAHGPAIAARSDVAEAATGAQAEPSAPVASDGSGGPRAAESTNGIAAHAHVTPAAVDVSPVGRAERAPELSGPVVLAPRRGLAYALAASLVVIVVLVGALGYGYTLLQQRPAQAVATQNEAQPPGQPGAQPAPQGAAPALPPSAGQRPGAPVRPQTPATPPATVAGHPAEAQRRRMHAAASAAPSTPAAAAAPGSAGPPAVSLTDDEKRIAEMFGDQNKRQVDNLPRMARMEHSREQMSDGAIMAVVTRNKKQVQLCFERALKAEPTMRNLRVDVELQVGISGTVTSVTLTDPNVSASEIGGCLKQTIKRWHFPPQDSEYQTTFPLLLQAQ